MVFAPSAPGTGITARRLVALNLGSTATATIQNPDASTDRLVLVTAGLAMPAGSTLDLGGNDMIVQGGSLTAITNAVAGGYQNGNWTGTGITSSLAAGDGSHLTALGVIQNAAGSTPVYSSFDHQPATVSDVLVRYTYVGDANLDGTVDGSDYSLIDNGFATPNCRRLGQRRLQPRRHRRRFRLHPDRQRLQQPRRDPAGPDGDGRGGPRPGDCPGVDGNSRGEDKTDVAAARRGLSPRPRLEQSVAIGKSSVDVVTESISGPKTPSNLQPRSVPIAVFYNGPKRVRHADAAEKILWKMI